MSQESPNSEPNKPDSELDLLDANELEIETAGRTFMPKPEKTYRVQFDVNEKVEPKESDRFKDQQGRPTVFWPTSVRHVNGRVQTWNTNKTNAFTINEIKRGMKEGKFTWALVTRHGNGQRGTSWEIKGVNA
jgi:hypothetical protein